MSDNENGLSVSFSSASSRRTSSESLEESFRKILNARDKGISTAFLERYAVTSGGLKVLRFLNVRRVGFTADPSNRGRVSGHCILLELRDKTLSFDTACHCRFCLIISPLFNTAGSVSPAYRGFIYLYVLSCEFTALTCR